MKILPKTLLSAALIALSGVTAFAQDKNTGVIDYELNAKMPSRGGEEEAEERVITLNQHFFFTGGKGKLETDRPDFGGGRDGNRPQGVPDGPPPGGGEGMGPRTGGTGRGMRGGRMFGGGGNSYVDLANKKYIQLFTKPSDSTKTYFAEEDYSAPKDVKLSDKTKKIAGYTCKKASVTLGDELYTVWYTQELPFSYSPINGLLPEEKGVVLAAEGSTRSFTAKKVNLKPVEQSKTALPANAEKVSEEELHKIRREEMQKFRGRQNGN